MRISAAILAVLAAFPLTTQAQDLIPDSRFAMSQDLDLPGGDLAQMFDTTLDACQRACLTNSACTAMTFNANNGSCFPKANPGEGSFFGGALSGQVLTVGDGAEGRAVARRGEIPFIYDWEFASATQQAANLGNEHFVNGWTAEELRQAATDAFAANDIESAMRFLGAAVVLTDAAGDWNDYALALAQAANTAGDLQYSYRDRAVWAAVNAYLRAERPQVRHTVLVTLGDTLEAIGRGREKVAALRLAQSLQPRDDTAVALEQAIALYGFRIVETLVQADTARPRICASFSESLADRGVDYASFVQLTDPGLTVSLDGQTQLCVEGVQHGATYRLTFRAGLPAADGQTLATPVEVTQYVRDRSPGARFPGRGYILPAGAGAAIPVETVNTERLDLTLYRVTDRNILRAMQDGYFGTPMQTWQQEPFAANIGAQIWEGTAEVGQEVNTDITTRLPMADALQGQPPGIYALQAAVPGVDLYDTAPAWQWFVVSDLGLTTLSGADGLHVIARSLGTAAAVTGATVDLVSQANEVLGSATTDALGHVRFDAGLARGRGAAAPAMVVVRKGDDMAFLSLTDPEFDLSDRGVEGRPAAPPVDVFLTTDRGAYRAGETVHVTALARDPEVAAIAGLPMTAVWFRPDGVEHSRAVVTDQDGGYVFSQPVGGNAPRGVWRLEMRAEADGPALASQTFLVEDFLPERIDFALSLPDQPITLGATPDLTIAARYLFGAPGADLAVEGEVLLQQAAEVEGFAGYVFGDQNAPFSTVMESLPPTMTDPAGTALVTLSVPQADNPGVPLELVATVRVAEGSGRPVERQLTRALDLSGAMIGVKPAFDGAVPEGAEATFQIIGIGPGAEGAPANWKVSRIETDYQWYQQDGQWFWEPVTTRTPVGEGTVTLGTAPVQISVPVQWGEYELRVEGANVVTTTGFAAGWYAPAGVRDTPDTLEASLDKPAYAAGETAKLRIVPRAAGTALITVLSNRVVAMQAVAVNEGENLIDLPVTDEWGAGVYVTASVLRPMDVAAGRNPQRAMGLSYAAVAPGDRQLQVGIEALPESAPRAPLDVVVRVAGAAEGETAFVTLAAVDQGILNLTAFTPPDPSDHYFGQRRLGVGIRDVYGRLIDGLSGAEGTLRSGGDAGANARMQAPPPTEQLVAFFSGPVQVGADGAARVSFDMPSFNGEVRLMAIAWTPTAVGQADASVLVRDPVVVTASLPRFMAPGDESRLLLEIVHATGPSGEMQLAVTGDGVTIGSAPSSLRVEDKGKATVSVPVTAGSAGIQTIDVALTTPDGRVLTKTLTLPVQSGDPEVARISRFDLAPGQTFTFDQAVFDGLDPATARATLAAGPIARLNAPGLLASLDRYPYGCTEQITSKALPLLYFDEIATAMRAQGAPEIGPRVQQAIDAVLLNQTAEGAFGLWQPASGDFWLDAFVTDFLSRARAAGYRVPDQAFRNALANLRNQVNYAPDFTPDINNGGEALAYALMVLAREGAAAVGDLRYYADVKGDDFATALAQAQLGAALASYGDQVRADAMFAKAAARLNQPLGADQIFRADYGTDDRDTAGVLTLAVEAGSNAVDREALVSRLASRDAPMSTQEATWRLLAAHALLGSGGDGLTINGQPATGPVVQMLAAGTTAAIGNTGDRATTLTVTAFGVPTEPQPAGGNGYAIARSYFTLDGQPVDVGSVAQGTRLVTVLDITPFARGEARLMVSDPLPAGFEIDNPNLIAGGSTAQLSWLTSESYAAYSEFRQDRFLTAIDRYDNTPFRLAYIVRAVSPGTFHHPAALVEDMYRPDYRATSDAGRVTVIE